MDLFLKLLMGLFLKLLMDIILELLMDLILELLMDLILKLMMDLILKLQMELILSQLFTASISCFHLIMKFSFVSGWRWVFRYWWLLDRRLVRDITYLEVHGCIVCGRSFYFRHCMVCLSCNTMRMRIVFFYNCLLRLIISVPTAVYIYQFAFCVVIIINIKDCTLRSVPSPQLQLLAPTLLRSSNCSPSVRSVAVWFQRDSVLWHSL